jgi:RNA polymerase sigma-70 factor, ECF subfamily
VNPAPVCDVVPHVTVLPRRSGPAGPASGPSADDAADWLVPLRGGGEQRDLALTRLHALLLRAARFEAARRRPLLPGIGARDLEDLALQSADDALVAVLARLDSFRGDSRFTTWVWKFAINQTAVSCRRRAWQGREIPLEPGSWDLVPDRGEQPQQHAEDAAVLAAVRHGIAALTPHQRDVLVALALDEVPIDVLAERLGTTRGALYKTLHDARRNLRRHLAEQGLAALPAAPAEETR